MKFLERSTVAVITVTAVAGGAASVAVAQYYPVKVSPKKVSLTVTPGRDPKSPYVFTAKGKITLPAGVSTTAGCSGKVRVTAKKGTTSVGSKTVSVSTKCRYTATIKLTMTKVKKKTKITFTAKFLGNTVLNAKAAKSVTVFAG